MFNREKSLQQLKKLFAASPVRLIGATVISVEEGSCTVQPFGSTLILPGVTHFVSGGPVGSERKVVLVPRVGSQVFVGLASDKVDPQNLCIYGVSDAETLIWVSGKHIIESGPDGLGLYDANQRHTKLTPALFDDLLHSANQ